MKPGQADLTRQAVAIMTAWTDDGDDTSFSIETVANIIRERGNGDDMAGAIDVISGFMNLTGMLLAQRLKDTGQDERTTLQMLGAHISSGH